MPDLKYSFLLISLCLLLIACRQNNEESNPVIAKVNSEYLHLKDIQSVIPAGLPEKDSIELAELYVNNWIDNRLILKDASNILTSKEKDFTEKIREYRNSLLVYEWEKKITQQQIDTVVTDEEITTYYNENQTEFLLQQDIIRAYYIKLNAKSLQSEKAKILINKQPIDFSELEQFCKTYAVNYFIDPKTWLLYDEFTREIPVNQAQKNEIMKGNALIVLEDQEYEYILRVLDFKLKGTLSPLALQKSSINNIIIQKRKNDILRAKKLELRREAEDKSKFVIYSNTTQNK